MNNEGCSKVIEELSTGFGFTVLDTDKLSRQQTVVQSKLIGREDVLDELSIISRKEERSNAIVVGKQGVGKEEVLKGYFVNSVNDKLDNGEKALYIIGEDVNYKGFIKQIGVLGFIGTFKEAVLDRGYELYFGCIGLDYLLGDSEKDTSMMYLIKEVSKFSSIIGTTTPEGYKRINDKTTVGKLFTEVKVDEPIYDEIKAILESKRGMYEEKHGIGITDEAIERAIALTNMYVKDKSQPLKSEDLLDLVSAKLSKEGQDTELTEEHLNEYINDKLGIESNMTDNLDNLKELLDSKIKGQEEATKAVSDTLLMSELGLSATNRPKASFLLHGTTGTGKTEIARRTAELVFGSRDKVIKVDMSEFVDGHSSTKLLGAPPSYVGYGSPTVLDPLKRDPKQVIIFDEFEKSHPNIMRIFLQVIEDGVLTDSEGKKIDFTESILFFTTNAVPTNSGGGTASIGFGVDMDSVNETARPKFEAFPVELVNRFDHVIKFNNLTEEVYADILDLKLKELNEEFARNKGYTVTINSLIRKSIVSNIYDSSRGARPVVNFINSIRMGVANVVVNDLGAKNFMVIKDVNGFKVVNSDGFDFDELEDDEVAEAKVISI